MKIFMPTHEGSIVQTVTAMVAVKDSTFCLQKRLKGMESYVRNGDYSIYRITSPSGQARVGFSDLSLDFVDAGWPHYLINPYVENFVALPNKIKYLAMFSNQASLIVNIQRGVFVDV